MSGTLWIPGTERLTPVGTSGVMQGGPARVVWHSTEAPSGKTAAGGDYFDVMHRVLVGKASEPHILWDPLTDRMGQYFPLDRSARALKNDAVSGLSTNKCGAACIQVEVVAYASKPFTAYWKPGPNFRSLMAAIRSWGIPDAWPAGQLSVGGEDVSRDLATYRTKGGHYGHCNVPGNSHWDPGAIDQQAIFRAAGDTPPPPDPTPTKWHDVALGGASDLWGTGAQVSKDQAALDNTGFPLSVDGFWGPNSAQVAKNFQAAAGISADGVFGSVSREQIRRVPAWRGGIGGGYLPLSWQQTLASRGWRIDTDGVWGPQSDAVLKQFQTEKKLPVTGRRDAVTWTALHCRAT